MCRAGGGGCRGTVNAYTVVSTTVLYQTTEWAHCARKNRNLCIKAETIRRLEQFYAEM